MKAIILAAGYATRLWPLTKDTPKPLLEVKGKPIIDHIIEKIWEIGEIDKIFVVTNDKFYQNFCLWQKNFSSKIPVKIVNDLTKTNDDRLGSLGDIKFVVENENVDEDILVIAGDNLFEFSLLDAYKLYEHKGKSTIALYDVADTELAKLYGIVSVDHNHKIIHFEEKPAKPKSTLSSTGIYFYPRDIIWKIVHFVNTEGKKDKAGDFLEWLYKQDDIFCYVTKENWFDIGSLDQLEKARQEFLQKRDSKTVVITGGAGFIGSHLCDHLISRGDYVICVDNLFTGKKENVAHLLNNSRFHFIEHDIIKPLFIDRKIDQIYNLACPASPVHYQFNAIRTIKANTIGVINMLGLAKSHNARILQASTSEVYGDPLEHPQKESYRGNVNPIGIRACYDEGKRVAETLFFDYNRQNNVDIRVVRIFNTYGPRMARDDGRVVSNFIVQALEGKDITIYGDGKQTRSFCYVSDLIEGLYAMMNQDKGLGPINVGNPNEFSVLELAKQVILLTGSDSKLVFKDLPSDDPSRRNPDISSAKAALGWQPRIQLEEGLKRTIAFFR